MSADMIHELLVQSDEERVGVHGVLAVDMDFEGLENGAAHRQRPRADRALLTVMMAAVMQEAAELLKVLDENLSAIDLDGASEDGHETLRRVAAQADRNEEIRAAELRAAGGDRALVAAMPRH